MISEFVRESQQLAAPCANHLWQSTLFALVAACLTVLLKKNPARIRFTIWFVASAKFLLPFAVLVQIGKVLAFPRPAASPIDFAVILAAAGQPFRPTAPPKALHSIWPDELIAVLPALLGIVWIAGMAGVLAMWWQRWLQVSRIRRLATPMTQGPETDCLHSLQRESGIAPVAIMLVESCLEPGIFGVFHPVLLWPAGLSGELGEPELRAILAHEVWHVRRNDNFAAAVQMLIEATFWFHPLVWWLGLRQMEEREQACDEGVLGQGSDPGVYAEAVLKACRFCVGSPLACVAGVNGSNLKKRIVRIMSDQKTSALPVSRKLVLCSLALLAISVPVILGMNSSSRAMAQTSGAGAPSGPMRVTALTRNTSGDRMTLIKHLGGGTSIRNATVKALIEMAYGVKDYQLKGGPGWIDHDRFDIAYTGGAPIPAGSLVSSEALKEVLAQRFHLVIRQVTQPGPVFALVVGEGGARLPAATPPSAPGTDEPALSMRVLEKDGHGQISITGGPGGLADRLSADVGHPIVDRTGLTGIYSIHFQWATTGASVNSISGDLQQQLGLALVPQEGPVETAVIDSVTMPTES